MAEAVNWMELSLKEMQAGMRELREKFDKSNERFDAYVRQAEIERRERDARYEAKYESDRKEFREIREALSRDIRTYSLAVIIGFAAMTVAIIAANITLFTVFQK